MEFIKRKIECEKKTVNRTHIQVAINSWGHLTLRCFGAIKLSPQYGYFSSPEPVAEDEAVAINEEVEESDELVVFTREETDTIIRFIQKHCR